MGQSEALKYETAGQKAGFVKRIMDYNLEKTYTDKQNEILKAMTKQEVNELAKKQLQYDKMSILVVGDKSKVLLPLTKLGYEVIELDMDGNEIKGPDLKKNEMKVNDRPIDGTPNTNPNTVKPLPRNTENPR